MINAIAGNSVSAGKLRSRVWVRGLVVVWMVVVLQGVVYGQSFVHPGCLSTAEDLERMAEKVAAGAQPWVGSWDRLVANSFAQLSYAPNPQATICRGGACSGMGYAQNYIIMCRDAAAAYQCALRYRIGGDARYADKAVEIMDVWADTLTLITGDSNALLAIGAQGYQWACAAELLRDYAPWVDAGGFGDFQEWLLVKFYPECRRFLQQHNGTCDTHYWANWDLFAMNAMITIGVVCDRRDIYEEAIAYFHSGVGNGSADRLVSHMHPGYLGQFQESGRDQGHATLGPALLGVFCEVAWNQGDDLYGHAENQFLASTEYIARYNVQPLTNTVPFVTYINCDYVVHTDVSPVGRGIARPGWDLIYNHYVNRLGLSAPCTTRMAAQVRPEGGGGHYGPNSGGYDQLGFTTLTHSLDPIPLDAVPAPSSLRADVRGNTVVLSWWGSAHATGYNVKRADAIDGPYTLVAAGLPPDSLTYTDIGLARDTTYAYAVSAMVGGSETADSPPVAVMANRRLDGDIIGSSGSWNNAGATKETVFDDSLENFFDAPTGNGQWTGLDLGVPTVITQVRYCPRRAFPGRMVGGRFQGANVPDFSSGVATLFTIADIPPEGTLTTQDISNPNAFRYVRYLSPNNGFGNVAEVAFYGDETVSVGMME